MPSETKVTWIEDKRFLGQSASGHGIVVDGSAEKLGPSPMELVLMGTLGCTAYDVAEILRKKREAVTGLQVSATATRAEEPPMVYTEINITYTVHGRGVRAKSVEDAIRLSKEKYCSASIMLGKTAQIKTSYILVEEGG